MASIKEVARKANVGVGTVSRVLNSTGYVSDETRKKVEEAMKELNYIPNELARNLSELFQDYNGKWNLCKVRLSDDAG